MLFLILCILCRFFFSELLFLSSSFYMSIIVLFHFYVFHSSVLFLNVCIIVFSCNFFLSLGISFFVYILYCLLLFFSGYFFPCKMCGHHFIQMLNDNPVNATSRQDLTMYLCNLHNNVNLRLNKEIYNCTASLQKDYGGDCGCSESDNSTATNNTEPLNNGTL